MRKKHQTAILLFLLVCFNVYSQDSIVVNSLKSEVGILASDSLEGRGYKCASKALAIDYITRKFETSGFAPFNGSYLQHFMTFEYLTATEGTNIIGVIEGTDSILKNEYIVIAAHYDHLGWKMNDSVKVIYNGADDNASGVASIIETGKILLSNREKLKRSILLIAFDGEEAGLKGSTDFIKKKVVDPQKIKLMFSLDMVGMYSKNKGVNLTGLFSLLNGKELLNETALKANCTINKTTNTIENRTDTKPFGDKKIPAIHITTGTSSPYHKPEDDSNLLDYDGMAKIVQLVSEMSMQLANESSIEASPVFAKTSGGESTPVFKIGICMNYGSGYHYYKDMYYNGKSIFEFQTGLTLQLKLSKHMCLQPNLSYETFGSGTGFGTMRVHSLTPAMEILFTTKNTPQKPLAFLGVGGYYRYNFAASAKSPAFDFKNSYTETETGLKIGIGFQYDKLQIGIFKKYGLTAINKDFTNGAVYNRSTCFSITKYF
ncbi:MAG: M28 family peptidase [Paludibacter sp.]